MRRYSKNGYQPWLAFSFGVVFGGVPHFSLSNLRWWAIYVGEPTNFFGLWTFCTIILLHCIVYKLLAKGRLKDPISGTWQKGKLDHPPFFCCKNLLFPHLVVVAVVAFVAPPPPFFTFFEGDNNWPRGFVFLLVCREHRAWELVLVVRLPGRKWPRRTVVRRNRENEAYNIVQLNLLTISNTLSCVH